MARVKRGVTTHRRHKKVLKLAKGYYGNRSKIYRVANEAVMRAQDVRLLPQKISKKRLPQIMDCSYQRCLPLKRYQLQQIHQRFEKCKR